MTTMPPMPEADDAAAAMDDAPIDESLVLDHEYDGIREYDNPLPGWWVWIFALSIVYAVPYFMWYHMGDGASIEQNYEAELAAYAEHLIATYGELEPDEATILHYMNDETAMVGMAGLFKGKCAQCHLADGRGNVGPNLTDHAYKNVKVITDIPDIITNGVIAKGMPEWGSALSKTQIVLLSAYVAHLRGMNVPGGKAPEPEARVIDPWPAPPPPEPAPDPAP
ncbi:MAG: c-type cytochrome [Phycisphaerales bacterium]|nr:c-type cytochrome [Phycisphaerales bacterium]